MERRKFIIGAGALASGSAAAVGTGAFSSVDADRSITIEQADEANAFVGLDPLDNEYVDYGGNNDTLVVNIDDNEHGEGVNTEANFVFDSLFKITNQSSQSAWFWLDDASPGDWFYIDEEDIIRGIELGNGSINIPIDHVDDGQNVHPLLESGDSIEIGVSFNTIGTGTSDLEGSVTIVAEADEARLPKDEVNNSAQGFEDT